MTAPDGHGVPPRAVPARPISSPDTGRAPAPAAGAGPGGGGPQAPAGAEDAGGRSSAPAGSTATAHCIAACDWTATGTPADVHRAADKHSRTIGHATSAMTTYERR